MLALKRQLYRLILHLHPASFRNRFAREMALDFEDALATYGFGRLLLDAASSLARQWATRSVFAPQREHGPDPVASAARRPLPRCSKTSRSTPFELFRGSALVYRAALSIRSGCKTPLAVAFLSTIWSPAGNAQWRFRFGANDPAQLTRRRSPECHTWTHSSKQGRSPTSRSPSIKDMARGTGRQPHFLLEILLPAVRHRQRNHLAHFISAPAAAEASGCASRSQRSASSSLSCAQQLLGGMQTPPTHAQVIHSANPPPTTYHRPTRRS